MIKLYIRIIWATKELVDFYRSYPHIVIWDALVGQKFKHFLYISLFLSVSLSLSLSLSLCLCLSIPLYPSLSPSLYHLTIRLFLFRILLHLAHFFLKTIHSIAFHQSNAHLVMNISAIHFSVVLKQAGTGDRTYSAWKRWEIPALILSLLTDLLNGTSRRNERWNNVRLLGHPRSV